jgi:hypothetical protein
MKDERLWMRFPISFDEDPTIEILSDAAFRAFVSMNGYSRRNDLDGLIPARLAEKRWGVGVLQEIVDARPESPILALLDGQYALTKYARHQDTTEARAIRSATNSENGKKGGRPPKGNRSGYAKETDPVIGGKATGNRVRTEHKAESESESELEISDTQLPSPESLELNAREFTTEEIRDSHQVLDKFLGYVLDDLAMPTLIAMLIEDSARPVDKIGAYMRRCTQRSQAKVRGLAEVAKTKAESVPSLAVLEARLRGVA